MATEKGVSLLHFLTHSCGNPFHDVLVWGMAVLTWAQDTRAIDQLMWMARRFR